MPHSQPRRFAGLAAVTSGLIVMPLVLSTAPATALAGTPVADSSYAFTAKLAIGDTFRSCTGTLINAQWLLTASSCFADNPAADPTVAAGAPKWKTTATIGRSDLTTTAGQVREVVELVPRTDRDLVLARLATPVQGITPLRLGATTPTQAEQLKGAAYGRTKDTWVPDTLHSGSFTVNQVDPTRLRIDGTPVCKGDTGAPVVREKDGQFELAAVASASWQGGCLGTSETRTGATATRVDDLASWVKASVASTLNPWRLQFVTTGADKGLYHAVRDSNWDWSRFGDVEKAAGEIGEIQLASDAAISGTNTVLAVGADGVVREAQRNPDGTWVSFRSLTAELGTVTGLKKISVTSMGTTLGLVGITDSGIYHAVRNSAGKWTKWGDVSAAVGPLTSPTDITLAQVGNTTHVGVVANNRAYHTIRRGDGTWGVWGEITKLSGAPSMVTKMAFSGTGTDLQAVLVEPDGGVKHVARYSSGSWSAFGDLTAEVLGTGPVTSVSAATVDNEFHLAIIRNGVIKHTMRHIDGTWEPVDTPPSAPANPTTVAITGSWN